MIYMAVRYIIYFPEKEQYTSLKATINIFLDIACVSRNYLDEL